MRPRTGRRQLRRLRVQTRECLALPAVCVVVRMSIEERVHQRVGQLLQVTNRRRHPPPRALTQSLGVFTLTQTTIRVRPPGASCAWSTTASGPCARSSAPPSRKGFSRQRELLEEKLVGRISTLGAHIDRMEELAGRITTLGGAAVSPTPGVEDLRSEVAHTTSAMLDQLQLLEANVQALEVSAQEAMEHAMPTKNGYRSPENPSWDWGILHQEEFRYLRRRVDYLETGSPTAPCQHIIDSLAQRVADLEGERPGGCAGGVPRSSRGARQSSVMEAKAINSLSPLTDDKSVGPKAGQCLQLYPAGERSRGRPVEGMHRPRPRS
ncbi:hypothetical protein N9L68_01640 [bacterium]|nr:hypothetical protein [bacterium]